MNIDQQIAYIPGGSSGIGLATAKRLSALGADVLILSRDQDRLKQAADAIKKSGSGRNRVDYRQLDVSNYPSVKAVLAESAASFGIPDILINCAGRSYPAYFEEISCEQFDQTMKINLYGIWHVTSVLFPLMKAKGGHIINISSMAGLIGVFGFTDYAASKFAIIGFSEALRSEGKQHGIKVSVVCPADTDTPSFQVENQTKPPETAAVSKAARLFQPEEIAAVLCRNIHANTFLIIPGLMPKLTYYLKRFTPGLVESIMDRIIRRTQNS